MAKKKKSGVKSQKSEARSRKPEALDDLKLRFRRRLLRWYGENGRDLPWRKTTDPYHILVSEVMLQQTQVETVVPKYREFLNRYPTLGDLAAAPAEEVRRTWYPLGYNIRPYRLHGIARETVERYGGKLPGTPEDLLAFKGIGRYTAGAILTFAFGKPAPILDTNVARVLHRVFHGGRGDLKRAAVRSRLWALAEGLLPRRKAYDFNQALMDLGALVCTARKPRCLVCPLRDLCRARKQ